MTLLRDARSWLSLPLALITTAYMGFSEDTPPVDIERPDPPAVATAPATDVGPTTARLRARVYPGGAPTTVYFDLEVEKRFAGRDVPRPHHWSGYRVQPERMEFFRAIDERVDERTLYWLDEDTWRKVLLYP